MTNSSRCSFGVYPLITCLLIIILANTNNAAAQSNHSVGLFSQLSTEQSGQPGVAIKYQWQFSSSFAFESQYSFSGDIKVKDNSSFYQGHQSLLSLGAVFIKHYSPELAIKFSGGANYVSSSSSEVFIQQSSISPYLRLALEYRFTEQFFVEIGQTSYFQSNQLNNHHNLFIGFNYLFSGSVKKQTTRSVTTKTYLEPHPENTTSNEQLLAKASPMNHSQMGNKQVNKQRPSWVIQLGAYSDELYAQQALIKLSQHSLLKLYHVEFFDGYFRIISPIFTDYQTAHQRNMLLKQTHGINNLIKQRK